MSRGIFFSGEFLKVGEWEVGSGEWGDGEAWGDGGDGEELEKIPDT